MTASAEPTEAVAAPARPKKAAEKPVETKPAEKPRRQKRERQQRPEDTMFFTRLRTHAKWVFVLLAAAFAIGFLAFGIGTGGGGIGDVLRDFFGGGSGTTSLEEAQQKVEDNPRDATAVVGLANQYQNRGRYEEAATTLENYSKLAPKDADVLRQLAALRDLQARLASSRASQLGGEQGVFSQTVYAFPGSNGFLGALGASPVNDAISNSSSIKAQEAQQQADGFYVKEVAAIEKLASLEPGNAQTQLQLGQAANAVGDPEKAIAAFERFLELAPDDPLAPTVKEQINAIKGLEDQVTPDVEQTAG